MIFIPTYNERDNVALIVPQLVALGLDADLLFIDDNSPDGTGEALDALARNHSGMNVIHRSGKLGIGSAHRDGIAYAYDHDYRRLITLDCDFSHSPSDIPRLIDASGGAALVVGSRYLREDSLAGWNFFRRFMTNLGHFMTKHAVGIRYDATGALRLYDLTRIPRDVIESVRADGYSFFFESLAAIQRHGCEIEEIAIVLPARTYGTSKMSVKEIVRSAMRIVALIFRR